MTAFSVTGYLLTHMAKVLRGTGHDSDQLFADLELHEHDLEDPETRVPLDVARQFWKRGLELSGDPLFGLSIAASATEGFPTLRYAFANSTSLGAAYERWARFYRLMTDAGTQSLGVDGDLACIRFDPRAPLPEVFEDWLVGQWLSVGRILTANAWRPERIIFSHSDRGRAAAYREWFDAPVEFGADHSALWFASELLDSPIPGADAALTTVLDRHIADVLRRLPEIASFADRVRASMARELEGGDPGAAAVARSLRVSERTLARRLADEGTSARELLGQLRRELAERYLRDPEISITEVAFLLGYSETAPFCRAFKRWTGATPSAFRTNRARSRKLLLTVTDTFRLEGLGLIAAPALELARFTAAATIEVDLDLPSGDVRTTTVAIQLQRARIAGRPSSKTDWVLVFDPTEPEVPPGTLVFARD